MATAATLNLLVCTVGGSPEPLVKSLLEWRPARVLFVPSRQTAAHVDAVLRAFAEAAGAPLGPGQYEIFPVEDAQSLTECLSVMRRCDPEVRHWAGRTGGEYQVISDFTAGTKCMTAALALQSRRWPCRFSYVGGERRSKAGVGVVETGSEQVVHWANPWDALGYQAIEDSCLLFDQQAFRPAETLLEATRRKCGDGSAKRTLSTFHDLCRGYGHWDRFQHKQAIPCIDNVVKNGADLIAALGEARAQAVITELRRGLEMLRQVDAQPLSRAMVADLLANAERRRWEARFDDGVARLYRATEALAQLALAARHGIPSTEHVDLQQLPEPLHQQWATRACDGKLRLGLQDDYELLHALGDDLGANFKNAGLHLRNSPLSARNQSILAHGFQATSEVVFEKLWGTVLALGKFTEGELPTFPRLALSGSSASL